MLNIYSLLRSGYYLFMYILDKDKLYKLTCNTFWPLLRKSIRTIKQAIHPVTIQIFVMLKISSLLSTGIVDIGSKFNPFTIPINGYVRVRRWLKVYRKCFAWWPPKPFPHPLFWIQKNERRCCSGSFFKITPHCPLQ